MQLAGDEKKIRALFSELSRAEAQAAPSFEKLWREAALCREAALRRQVSLTQQAPRFSKSLVVIAASLLVAVTVLFAVWSVYKAPAKQNAHAMPPQPTIENRPADQTREPEKAAFVHHRRQSHSTRRRSLARRKQSDSALEQQAAMLANWKSPTDSFVTSPTRSGFDSLPQLNEAVKDLQSFLQKKESNQ